MHEIGFMQGRLTAPVGGKIQAFPWERWRDEFRIAEERGFSLLEWTLDQARLRENPLLTAEGRAEIQALSERHGVDVGSLTADCFMQAPFFKRSGAERSSLLCDLGETLAAAGALGIRCVVLPLVDDGSLETPDQEQELRAVLEGFVPLLRDARMVIAFESDYGPTRLAELIAGFPEDAFGVNYDIGNSAALGYDPREETDAYGGRIVNVHVKDRLLGGTTVPLGEGAADLPTVFRLLKGCGYAGDYVLQTARAADGDDVGVLCGYRDLVARWIEEA
jgi:hexulose-6-phosphate isomerase